MNSKLDNFIKKAIEIPELSFVEAINLDRHINTNTNKTIFKTFSSNGFAPKNDATNMMLFLNTSFKKKKHTLKSLANKNLKSKEFLTKAFKELANYEINTINIVYSNYFLESNDIVAWQYFFNKYLLSYSHFKIYLSSHKYSNIFEVLKSSVNKNEIYFSGPMVSIIMPTFNNEKTILYAVQSIQNQTHQNFELIIVDDCSSDNTEQICNKLVKKDKRIKYLKNTQNKGPYIARNNGAKISQGKYITTLDADDWSFPKRLEYQVGKLHTSGGFKAHLGYYIRMHENGMIDSFNVCNNYCFDGILKKCFASLMIEKKFFDEILGSWDSVRFGADSELYYRILSINEKLIIEDIVPLYLALDRKNSLTNIEASKLGGELRSKYTENFFDFHKSASKEELYYSFPQNKRPFDRPKEMVINNNINYILVLGTYRVHKIFKKSYKRNILDNTNSDINVIYPKVGFFHALPEIIQILKWINKDLVIPKNLSKFIFRKENIATTPSNEFDSKLEYSISHNIIATPPNINLKDVDYFIFEISSLKTYFDTNSKLYFHANPNFVETIPYNKIPKEGIYSKSALNVPAVKKTLENEETIFNQFEELFRIINPKKTIIIGHLLDPKKSNVTRKQVNDLLKKMSKKFNFIYIDTSKFVSKYGFDEVDGVIDIHHIKSDGENALGQYIQKLISRGNKK